MEQDKDLVISQLMESNTVLNEEVARVRDSNRILRAVNKALHSANASLRRIAEVAQQNDEMFKCLCQGDFDAPVSGAEAGLAEASHEVEPLG
jgi:hypothetical protein